MLHDFFNWLQSVPGATDGDPYTSWSQQLVGSLHLWALIEGTHVLSLLLFAGTIFMVDLRMLGIAFRNTPFSTLNNKVLPLTVAGFVLIMATGLLLFFANPVTLYHSVFFRAKMIFLLIAAVNIFWFHYRVQKSQPDWDTRPDPPVAVRASGAISIASWALVIIFGRLIALTFYECETLKPGTFLYGFAECASEMREAIEAEEAAAAEAEAAGEATEEGTGEETPAEPEEAPAEEPVQ